MKRGWGLQLHPVLGIEHFLRHLWSYLVDPSKFISSLGDKIFGVAIGAGATVWTFTKTKLWPTLQKAYKYLRGRLSGRRAILVWLDADLNVGNRLVRQLRTRVPDSSIYLISSPAMLLQWPMRPSVVEAVVLLNTDVTKLATDDTLRAEIERRIQAFLLRGGGVVGSHDIIYRRTRNVNLESVFGGRITDFERTSKPIAYRKLKKAHPIAAHLPDTFSLQDGEYLWGTWQTDTDVIFTTDNDDARPLVVAREQGGGARTVWLHSGDQRDHVAESIAGPERNFLELLLASVEWVTRHGVRPENHPFVVAHRGVHTQHRENTRAAFLEAVRLGCDYVELDVRACSDGSLVIHHDEQIGGLLIADSPFATLHAKAAQLGYELETFEAILKALLSAVKLDVEIKEEGYEDKVIQNIHEAGWTDKEICVTSFHDGVLMRVKELAPEIRSGLLLGRDRPKHPVRTRLSELFPLRRLKLCGADFVAPNYKLLKLGFSRRVTSAGYPTWVWTVNDSPQILSAMRKPGVEAVITDTVQAAKRTRTQFQRSLTD